MPRAPKSRRWLPAESVVTLVSWEPTSVSEPAAEPDERATRTTTVLAVDDEAREQRVSRGRDASAPLEPGRRYELGALIGRGGMGEVFAAYDAQIGREVAIKLLHPDKLTPDALARFLREARIQGWLDHPSIPAVYELGSDDQGRPFFVMKRVSGITLAEILAARAVERGPPRFSDRQLLRAFVEICLAIEFAHTRGVLHRDLKPANMLLGEFGEVYVLDWGVARTLDESAATQDVARHTVEQAASTIGALGTPGYMSPEQVRGEDVDGRTDVYALGCVLFEILVGRRLHPEGLAGLTCALAGVVTSASEVRADVAPELDDLCRRATAANRDERIASARALGDAVQRYLDGDRDLATRRALAQAHLDAARRAAADEPRRLATGVDGSPDLVAPAVAMREAGRALALDPTLPGAAELVGRLMIEPPATTPAAAERDESLAEQRRKARVAIGVYAGYACLAPLLFAFGIRDALYLSALVAISALNVAIASIVLFRPRGAHRFVVALAHAAMFALIARMFTPLFIAPGVAGMTLMLYAQHPATRSRELLNASVLAVGAILGVWGAELCGWLSATTIVEHGSLRLVPPLDGIAEFPIIPALCCYPILLVGVAVEVAYLGAKRGREARRALQVQTWQLRQLVSLDEVP